MPKKSKKKVTKNTPTICRIPLTPADWKDRKSPAVALHEITWRIFRIMAEFVDGFQFLSEFKREVTIFGSARTAESNKWYQEARKLGGMLADCGFTVITGGGPGIMAAANRGASEQGGISVGLNIELPREQRVNEYVTHGRGFHYFFTRKVMLAASAQAYVFFPGGFGTLDEFFEMVVLIQTGKAQKVPCICVGKAFWQPLKEYVDMVIVKEFGMVTKEENSLYKIVDSAEEAFEMVETSSERTFF